MEMHDHNCCDGQRVFKGPWTPLEDERLIEYMKAHGHHRPPWKDVSKCAGLFRCGKSCRFRWLHYLRPSLNRERFTPEEIQLICGMQKTIGNKWAEIVKYLPGRSDNSVKNFWNKHWKKKMIKNHKNQTSSPTYPQLQKANIDLHSEPDFNGPINNFSNTGEIFASYMNGFAEQHHGDPLYDLITLNNDPTTFTIPTPIPIGNHQFLKNDPTLSTNCDLARLPAADQLFPSPFFNTSPINYQSNFQDDKLTWEILTKSTNYQSLSNGENSSGWTDLNSSYNQVQEKNRYYESNNLYNSSLWAPQEPDYQLIGDPFISVTTSDLNNHNMMMTSGANIYNHIHSSHGFVIPSGMGH